MRELVACQQAVRLAWARRLRRLTPLPCPVHGVCWSGLWLDLSREQRASGVQIVGLFNGLAEFCVDAGDTTWTSTPCSRRRGL